jgi:Amt family ammonium transporter
MGVELLEWLRIDDPIGVVSVHGFCGIWGTLSLGLFACGKYGASGPTGPDNSAVLNGLFYHGGFTLLKAQFIGRLRVSEEGELFGLDLHEHGISAYPEYVISSLATPAGMPKDLTGPKG